MAQCDLEHLVGRRHFEVQRQVGRGLDAREVVVADMAPVLAQMRGDPVAADRGDDLRRAHRVGMLAAARIADRRDMVDVDAEAQTRGAGAGQAGLAPAARLDRLGAGEFGRSSSSA